MAALAATFNESTREAIGIATPSPAASMTVSPSPSPRGEPQELGKALAI